MISLYQQLCPVLFGTGALSRVGEKAKEYGAARVFCVCDKGVKQTGIVERIEKYLVSEGIDMFIYDRVLPDAPDTMVEEAGNEANRYEADLIIGVGGGSSLDTAKAVAMLHDNQGSLSQYYLSQDNIKIKTPLILIPTASGTGSEVTIMSVIHDTENHAKKAVFRAASLAIVDPELTISLPPYVTATTALDAMAHAIESYTSRSRNPKSDLLALHAIRLIGENIIPAYENGRDIVARENLAFASNIAGMAFNDAGVHFGHAIAHEFGVQFHMPHGLGCALTLPEVIQFSSNYMKERMVNIAFALGMQNHNTISDAEATNYTIHKIIDILRKTDMKSLKAQGISMEDAKACAKGAVEKNGFIVNAPGPVSIEVVEKLIENLYCIYQ